MDTVIKAVMLNGCEVGHIAGCADDVKSFFFGDISTICFDLYHYARVYFQYDLK